jgi:hypothetical protein
MYAIVAMFGVLIFYSYLVAQSLGFSYLDVNTSNSREFFSDYLPYSNVTVYVILILEIIMIVIVTIVATVYLFFFLFGSKKARKDWQSEVKEKAYKRQVR